MLTRSPPGVAAPGEAAAGGAAAGAGHADQDLLAVDEDPGQVEPAQVDARTGAAGRLERVDHAGAGVEDGDAGTAYLAGDVDGDGVPARARARLGPAGPVAPPDGVASASARTGGGRAPRAPRARLAAHHPPRRGRQAGRHQHHDDRELRRAQRHPAPQRLRHQPVGHRAAPPGARGDRAPGRAGAAVRRGLVRRPVERAPGRHGRAGGPGRRLAADAGQLGAQLFEPRATAAS